MADRSYFFLYVLVCLEIGIFLVLVPWSAIWERNYFLDAAPSLRPFVTSPWLRGAVAGLGVANIYMALREVASRREQANAPGLVSRAERGSDPHETSPRESWAASED